MHKQKPEERSTGKEHAAERNVIAAIKSLMTHGCPFAAPVPPQVYRESEYLCFCQRIGYQRNRGRSEAAYLTDNAFSRIITPIKLCLVDPLPLEPEGRDKPERYEEHEGVIDMCI